MNISELTFDEVEEKYNLKQLSVGGKFGPLYYSADDKYLVKRFKKKKKKKRKDKDITVEDFRQWVLRYRELTEELTGILAEDKYLGRRVKFLPLIDCGEDYFIKDFYHAGPPTRNIEDKPKSYYPDYFELKEKLFGYIEDETLKEMLINSLLNNGGVFWSNSERKLIFNDLEF